MKNNILCYILVCISLVSNAQSYEFKTIIDLDATEVISQGNTGTCWSFSTSSFLESEIMRLTGKHIDLSEMYTVRNTYPKKAWNYVMRQGKAQFSEGGLAHDVINSVSQHGLVPDTAFKAVLDEKGSFNHSKLIDTLKITLNQFIKAPKQYKSTWQQDVTNILDIQVGENISNFNYDGISYTPMSFLKMTKINPDDYISITSFTHQPFYTNFILNIPDNFSNGSFYNVPLDDMVSIVNNALEKGFTVELDCDVSEKTFSAKYGLAIIPNDGQDYLQALTSISTEKTITQTLRQEEFENYNTTDDHLMHITGLLKDQNGTTYYKVKNSWGKNSKRVGNDGYIYMSVAYFKLKSISIMVHKDALNKHFKRWLLD
ncbi:C1 family peptidase [Snuella sedimenti]|uniref:Aminopeptidase n=1 Tax=Snuella sedimenti TaxID=2798802 RepID=A0A8J7II36_9FLAO|nr:C1 family peptidase [Snuella sedimenti]MBJ6369183.1 aminopeptidase [Snuella sedimenti]